MINLHPSSIFQPDNINNSNLEKVHLFIRNNEFLTFSSGLTFLSEDELTWSGLEVTDSIFLGYIENRACYVSELLDKSSLMPETQLSSMRSLLGNLSDSQFTICSRSLQLMEWVKTNRFCGLCGNQMKKHLAERAMQCSCSSVLIYPKISPCIIVLVTKGEDLLLAHNKNFPGKFYSTLAGFIEAGESAEEAIHREIMEEVNVRVSNINYYGSQSWPFPGQLMLGYHAEYKSGDLEPDGEEIDDAQWFHYNNLPSVPTGNISISGRLIENFLERQKS